MRRPPWTPTNRPDLRRVYDPDDPSPMDHLSERGVSRPLCGMSGLMQAAWEGPKDVRAHICPDCQKVCESDVQRSEQLDMLRDYETSKQLRGAHA